MFTYSVSKDLLSTVMYENRQLRTKKVQLRTKIVAHLVFTFEDNKYNNTEVIKKVVNE